MISVIFVVTYFLVFVLLLIRRPAHVSPLVWCPFIVFLMLVLPVLLLRR